MQKILIIDDEKDILEMLRNFLAPRGYAIAMAMNGDEGVRQFDKENPDIVMCDIRMPVKDGFQFLNKIRTSRKWVPVIIISAITDPVSILKGYDFEADYYITKPIDLNNTLKAIQIMLSIAPLREK